MELKKYEHADLEKQKGIFLKLGYVVVLAGLLIAFEWGNRPSDDSEMFAATGAAIEEEIIPITMQKPPEPPPAPEPPKVTVELEIVEDEVEVADVEINAEVDENTKIEIPVIEQEEEKVVEEEVFVIVEEMPKFQGQDKDAFRNFIAQNLKFPEIAAENGIQGTVYVQFAVNSKGEVVDVRVARGVDPALDAEALRVVKSTPNGYWTPGRQRGKPVKVQFTFPIRFVLN